MIWKSFHWIDGLSKNPRSRRSFMTSDFHEKILIHCIINTFSWGTFVKKSHPLKVLSWVSILLSLSSCDSVSLFSSKAEPASASGSTPTKTGTPTNVPAPTGPEVEYIGYTRLPCENYNASQAPFGGGDGSSSSPYLVGTVDQFLAIGNATKPAHYRQCADIDFKGNRSNPRCQFVTHLLAGAVYDGNYYKDSGIYAEASTCGYGVGGLFIFLRGTLKNLRTEYTYAEFLPGHRDSQGIPDYMNFGSVAFSVDSTGVVERVFARGHFEGDLPQRLPIHGSIASVVRTGGIVRESAGTFTAVSQQIDPSLGYRAGTLGGLVASTEANAVLENVYSYGLHSEPMYWGNAGLVGAASPLTKISNAYSFAIPDQNLPLTMKYEYQQTAFCEFTGVKDIKFTNSYYHAFQSPGVDTSAQPLSLKQMSSQSSFEGFDFIKPIWFMPRTNPYSPNNTLSPILAWQCGLDGHTCFWIKPENH